jgi:hydroxymethylpyrimidine pyrophosphatase-like HAD family hydrolase
VAKKEVPTVKNTLILMDLDQTLLDRQYKITDKRILKKLRAMQNAGWLFGLNSDSPYQSMLLHAQALGLAGPLIAERGNCIRFVNSVIPVWHDERNKAKFAEVFFAFHNAIPALFPSIRVHDDVRMSRQQFRDFTVNEHSLHMLQHVTRAYSFGFHLYLKTPEGNTFPHELLDQVADTARRLFRAIFNADPLYDCNHDYGVCILHEEKSVKAKAMPIAISELGCERFYMIGDSLSDHLGDNRVIQCAVGNASPEYKAVSTIVATAPLTSGVLEILERIEATCV